MSNTATVSFTQAPAVVSESSLTPSPASVVADGVSAITVTFLLKDAQGRPVPNHFCGFTPLSHASVSPNSTLFSDANGQAVWKIVSTTPGTVTFSVQDVTDGFTLSVNITFEALPPPDIVTLQASATSSPADGVTEVVFTTTVKDGGSNLPVVNKSIGLHQSGNAIIDMPSQVTDANGQVIFKATDTSIESVTFTASEN